MLPADADARTKMLTAIRTVLTAVGEVTGERAERLAQIEQLFGEESLGSTESKG